ncbi:MAG: hypothetical protein CME62_00160 [Halobacteriovoraceae bacterium]|nr:hypothetical protein [Halobacteriovoraceae bacterium]|tara:strand:+ start:4109 stop:5107 length:999 start_codon:yes stop_codon:yes gene_type:complete
MSYSIFLIFLFLSSAKSTELKSLKFEQVPNTEVYNYFEKPLNVPDKNLGFKLNPSTQLRHVRKYKESIVYDVVYSIDDQGRRLHSTTQSNSTNQNFAVFFGCSFIFGIGINDDKTLPHFFQKNRPSYNVYNYGVGGTGPNYMLAQLQAGQLNKDQLGESGVLIYSYIPNHLRRANGLWPSLRWTAPTPYYEIQNEKLVREKNFTEGRYWQTLLYSFVGKALSVLGKPYVDFPQINQKHVNHTCQIIQESQKEFLKQFPTSKFYTLIHPSSKDYSSVSYKHTLSLIKCLKTKNISVIEMRYDLDIENYAIQNDHHPTALSNKEIAEKLKQVIL